MRPHAANRAGIGSARINGEMAAPAPVGDDAAAIRREVRPEAAQRAAGDVRRPGTRRESDNFRIAERGVP